MYFSMFKEKTRTIYICHIYYKMTLLSDKNEKTLQIQKINSS